MKIVAVIQARLTSTRLPAKILLDLVGKPAIQHCLTRASRIEHVDEIVVATTDRPDDDVTASVAKRLGFRFVRGSEGDVLSRYVLAARESKADAVVRLTSDCPLLDPAASSLVVDTFKSSQTGLWPFDYVSNTLIRRLPRGLDTEVLRVDALERAHREATKPEEREHVTLGVYSRPDKYRCGCVLPTTENDLSGHRWTLDTIEDYRFLYRVYEALGDDAERATPNDVLALLASRPELTRINENVSQKSVLAPTG